MIVQLRRLFVCSTNHHTIPCTSYWGTIAIVTILTPVYCVLTSAAPGVPARCGDYIALEHLSLALIGTHHVHISGGECSLQTRDNTRNLTPTNLFPRIKTFLSHITLQFIQTAFNIQFLIFSSPPTCYVTVSRYIIGKSRAYETLLRLIA